MRAAFLALALAGCATTAPPGAVVEVKVPVPVACRVQIPEPPRWALDKIPLDADVDKLMAAALAEVEQRVGYEIKLMAALAACTQEVSP